MKNSSNHIQPGLSLIIKLLREYGFQAVNREDARKINAASRTFFDLYGKGWGNWVAALGIAVSCITPLVVGGFPYWAIGLAVLSGIVFWRETNFDPLRAKFAEETMNVVKGTPTPIRDKKANRFLQNLAEELKQIDDTNDEEAVETIKAFIDKQVHYHNRKQEISNLDEKKQDGHKAFTDRDEYIHIIQAQLNTLLENEAEVQPEQLQALLTKDASSDIADQDLSSKQQKSLRLNKKNAQAIRGTKTAVGVFGNLAAYVGNGMGCFVAGMNFAGFVASCFGITVLPMSLTLTVGLVFAIGGVVAYKSNTVPAIKKVAKDFLYTVLDTSKDETKKRPTSYHVLRGLAIAIAVSASLIMGTAIGFFNYSFGIFLVGVFMNPAVLSNATALITLAGPITTVGMIVGATSGILVTLGTTCLFLRYITSGILEKLDNWYAQADFKVDGEVSNPVHRNEELTGEQPTEAVSKAEAKAEKSLAVRILHGILQAVLIATLVAVAVYSVNFFVLLPLPVSLQTMASIAVLAAGSIVYTFQALNVTTNGLKNYGSWLGDAQGQKIQECAHGLRAVELAQSEKAILEKSLQSDSSSDNTLLKPITLKDL
jgi:hypothetical protein